ncbi:MAG: hypothetical protein ABIG56_00660 [Candidatus Omnitrophota bacterium]
MEKKIFKILVPLTILSTLIILLPGLLKAGDFKQKFQQKMSTPSNIQFQQYEPYPSEENYDRRQERPHTQTIQRRGSMISSELAAADLEEEMFTYTPVISSYAIYKTDYKAELEEGVVTVKGDVLFEVFRKGWTKIPLIRSDVGLIDSKINRGASFIIMEAGKYYLMIDKPGRYSLDIEFLIKAEREREGGPGSFRFEVMPAPISQFEFVMPETEVEIFVEPSIKLELKKGEKKTVAWAIMPNTDQITVRWTKALPKETITQVELEPKVYVDVATHASIGEGIVQCQSSLKYSILQSEVSNMRIALPEDVSVLEVKGRELRDWKVSAEEGLQYLDVYLNFGVRGDYVLNLVYERKIGDGSVVADMPEISAVGVEREKGFFGIASATNVELAVNKLENATLIDIKELPPSVWSRATNPILLAFKYLKHPFTIIIDVTRHEELPVLVAAIDSANYITLQTDEGKGLTKVVYQVRNNVKQFLHLTLPKDATLWSVFVAGKPVKPAKDKNGDVLIPLEKSQLRGETITQFPVEVVYLDRASKMKFVGGLKLNLPKCDIPISNLNWSVYLPKDFKYFNFGGDIKEVKRDMPFMPFGVSGRAVQGRLMESSDQIGTQFSPQAVYKQEFEASKMVKGVLPIKIDIPTQGQLFRFSKLIVTEKESPKLSLNFVSVFKETHGVIRFLIFIGILFAVVSFFKRRRKRKVVL